MLIYIIVHNFQSKVRSFVLGRCDNGQEQKLNYMGLFHFSRYCIYDFQNRTVLNPLASFNVLPLLNQIGGLTKIM